MFDPQRADKDLFWVATSRKDMRALPQDVHRKFGFGLRAIQGGDTPANAAAFPQGGSGCMELKENHDRATFRTMYVAKFPDGVYVLHVFQKKSKSGIATPQEDIDLVQERYKLAEQQSHMNLADTKVKHK